MSTPKLKVTFARSHLEIDLPQHTWAGLHVTYVDVDGEEFPLVAIDDFYSGKDEGIDNIADATVYLQLGDDENPRLFHWNKPVTN